MSYKNILTERVDRTAVVTLNRPEKLNALSHELSHELDQELTLIENEPGVDVVILTGAGDRGIFQWRRYSTDGWYDRRGNCGTSGNP